MELRSPGPARPGRLGTQWPKPVAPLTATLRCLREGTGAAGNATQGVVLEDEARRLLQSRFALRKANRRLSVDLLFDPRQMKLMHLDGGLQMGLASHNPL